MSGREKFEPIAEEIDYLLAVQKQRAVERPRLVLVHGHHLPETECLPGETVEQAVLIFGAKEFPLLLSLTGLLITDCLCRHRLTPLSASQIERILSSDPFYLHHGANARSNNRTAIKPKRASIKVYIRRLRVQFEKTLSEAGLSIRSEQILVSETTDSNVVVYGLKVNASFRHR